MVAVPDGVIAAERELGRVFVTAEVLRAFASRSGDEDASPEAWQTAPAAFSLTFLALRRRGDEDLRIAANAFAVHGGHDIDQIDTIRAGRAYIVHAAIASVFEKSGRSGPLTVVERLARIEAETTRSTVAIVRERQIVRWRPRGEQRGTNRPRHDTAARLVQEKAAPAPSFEVGDVVAREVRRGPTREGIAAWAGHLGEREVLFTDRLRAIDLGYQDLVVPGPMLSAFVGQMLRRAIPEWPIRTLSMTFRQSLLADEPVVLTALVTERGAGQRLRCDLVIESGAGDICAIGSASLQPRDRR
jgi:hypothetical protein